MSGHTAGRAVDSLRFKSSHSTLQAAIAERQPAAWILIDVQNSRLAARLIQVYVKLG